MSRGLVELRANTSFTSGGHSAPLCDRARLWGKADAVLQLLESSPPMSAGMHVAARRKRLAELDEIGPSFLQRQRMRSAARTAPSALEPGCLADKT